MKRIETLFFALSVFVASVAQGLPSLQKNEHGAWQFMVDGKPFTMLAGELHNSSTGSSYYMDPIWKRMADKNLNTVIAPVNWELLEPEEGKFDFSQIDNMIQGAEREGLKLTVIWFGSWKNGKSTYVPAWVKKNTKRFPICDLSSGEKNDYTLSPLGQESMKADARAFSALMKHIAEVDKKHTVICMQVENEIGTLDQAASYMGMENRAARDFSSLANKAFKGQVPAALTQYLKSHEKTLHPAILNAWKNNGKKMNGTWEEVFGPSVKVENGNWQEEFSLLTDELFSAWSYASYVGEVVRQGKAQHNIPMYVNVWLKQAKQHHPGLYPSGAPSPHLFDIWRAAAPEVDFFAPDIYEVGYFDWVCQDYTRSGNPLFIPETKADIAGASRAIYTFGKYPTLCYAPFGIDGGRSVLSADDNDQSFDKAYGMLAHLMPTIQKYIGSSKITGLWIDDVQKTDEATMGDYTFSLSEFNLGIFQAVAGVTAEEKKKETIPTGVLLIQLDNDEFLVAGGLGSATLRIAKSASCKADKIGILSLDQVFFKDGQEILHRLNGDEAAFGGPVFEGGASVFKLKMFKY